MAKDPAFLFYPNDYIGGTMGMTFEEKGAYIELLMAQFNRGHMSGHMCGQIVGQNLWEAIKHKFVKDENGLFYNVRLEQEKINRQRFTESRRNNLTGKNQYTKKGHIKGHMTSHMENENENVNSNVVNYSTNTMFAKEISDSSERMLNCSRTLKQAKVDGSPENIRHLLRVFVTDLDGKDDTKPDLKEFQKHFINWAKINAGKYPMNNKPVSLPDMPRS